MDLTFQNLKSQAAEIFNMNFLYDWRRKLSHLLARETISQTKS